MSAEILREPRGSRSVALFAGSFAYAFVGTVPHVLFAYFGSQPFWSNLEVHVLAFIVRVSPEFVVASVPRAITFLLVCWFVAGLALTRLVLAVPKISVSRGRTQVVIAVLTPVVLLLLLALLFPFERSF